MPIKVLIADDNEDFVLLFGQALMNIVPDAEYMSAENGYRAISYLRFMLPNIPDFIFVDVKMPIMNGYEIVREIKKIPALAAVPLIMYSAVQSSHSAEELKKEGIEHFYLKPSGAEELHRMLRDVLKTKA